MAIKTDTFSSAGGGAGTDTLDDVTGRGATTTNAVTVGGVTIGTEYSLPTADGTDGQVVVTNGTGTLSFTTLDFTGGLEYKGSFNATAGTPSLLNAEKGDFYIIDTAGTIYGQTWAVGDHLLINEDMGGTITNSKIDKIDNTEPTNVLITTNNLSDLDNASTARTNLGLGTAATEDHGTATGDLVILENVGGVAGLPAVDGSQLVNITATSSDTLDDVTTRGATTTNAINVGTITTSGDILADSDASRTIGAEATRFITYHGDMNGAIRFKAKNNQGTAISKGQVVYISGVSGTVPEVKLAKADSASTMPAFGLALADANNQAEVQIITFGNLTSVNTTTYSLSANDTVFVSAATAGALVNSAPTGEGSLIQNIGRVVRADASAGIIKVGGAGRSAATPNLNDGNIFIGNASNQSSTTALSGVAVTSFNTATGDLTIGGDDLTADHTAVNYTAANANIDGHFSGVDTKLGTLLADITGESLNDLSDVSFTAGAGIDNYVLTYDNGTSSWGAVAPGGFTYSSITADPANAEYNYHYSATGTFTITLPASASGDAGKEIRVKNMGTGTITIDGNSTETIDGQQTIDLDVRYSSVTLVATGNTPAAWEIV